MLTEARNPRSRHIDRLSTEDVLRVMNEEDATVATAVHRALPQIAEAVNLIVAQLRRGGRLIYVGAGTSGRLAMLDAVECVPTFGTDPSLVRAVVAGGDGAMTGAVEGSEDDREQGRADIESLRVGSADAVVGIAASGRTPYVMAALEAAELAGAPTIGVACNVPSPLLDLAGIAIGIVVGPEVVAGSTRLKAGTAQKMVLNMLSTATMIQLGKVYGNRMVDVRVTNQKLAERGRRIIAEVAGVSEERAAHLLSAADNEVKTAIVMARRGVSPPDARALLARAGGKLAHVIGESED